MDGNGCKKAAILTWCYNNGRTNYGQILQCYAMQTMVRRLGYETKVIRYRKKTSDEKQDLDDSQSVSADLYELGYRLVKVEENLSIRILRFIEFIRENILLSAQCYTKEQVEKECLDCDVLICGSDQIWNPLWFEDIYALNFGRKSQKRIAYAASGALVESEEFSSVYKELGRCIERFDLVAVREAKSVEILRKYTNKDIIDVVDPTLLLTQNDWNAVAVEQIIEEPYIFSYSLGRLRTHKPLLKHIMKKYGAEKILFLTAGFYENEDWLETGGYFYPIKDAGPAQFIALIRDAKAVCTDSFHGLALSIVYQKQFFIFERDNPETYLSANFMRQENLLFKTGIKKRYVKCVKEIELLKDIDYEKIQLERFWTEMEVAMGDVLVFL